MSSGTNPELEAFIAEIATIASVPPSSIQSETQLVDDLGLDSLAMTELVATLVDQFGVAAQAEDLRDLPWDRLSVGALFDRYIAGRTA